MSATCFVEKPLCLQSELPRVTLLEASAGTGKTYAIERIFLDFILTHGFSINEVAVVTFSRKATAEMQSRIRGCLSAALDTTQKIAPPYKYWEIDDEARTRLRFALEHFEEANISTIHSFCQTVLAEQSVLSGLLKDPAGPPPKSLFHDAFCHYLRELAAIPSDERETLEQWVLLGYGVSTLEQLLTTAKDNVREPNDVLRAFRPRFDIKELQACQEELRALQVPPPFTENELKNDGASTKKREVLMGIQQVFLLLQNPTLAQLKTMAFQLHFLKDMACLLDTSAFLDPVQITGRTRTWLDAIRKTFLACPTKETIAVHSFLPSVHCHYMERCKQWGSLDFDRILLSTRDALRTDTNHILKLRLRNKFRGVLFDEFQDTDDLQWEIFRTLFVDSPAQTRVVAVGDPKQAIYKFRGGDFETYLAARETIQKSHHVPESAHLRVNHRSTPEMVDAYNRLLLTRDAEEPFFLNEADGITYNEETCVRAAHKNMMLVRGENPDAPALPAIGIVRHRKPKKNKDEQTQKNQSNEVLFRLSNPVLSQMVKEAKSLLTADARIKWVDDAGDVQHRKVMPKDLMFLVRTNAEARKCVSALQDVGIPAEQYLQDGLMQSPEAEELCEVFEALANPAHPSSVIKFMRCALMDIPFAELHLVSGLPFTDSRMQIWRRCEMAARNRDWLRLFTLLRDGLHARRRFAWNSEAERRGMIFHRLLDTYHHMARQRCPDITTLAKRARQRLQGEARESEDEGNYFPALMGKDAVRVLTVFKAKGLEAPIVFLALSGIERPHPESFHIFHDEKTKNRLVWCGSSKGTEADKRIRLENDLEARRMQYVALTRASLQVWLPLIENLPKDSTEWKPVDVSHRSYRAIHRRLHGLQKDASFMARHCTLRDADEFETESALLPTELTTSYPPPAALPTNAQPVRATARGLQLSSFSSLKSSLQHKLPATHQGQDRARINKLPAPVTPEQMPRGATAGTILHLLMERAPLDSVVVGQDFESWRTRSDVAEWLDGFWRHSRWSAPQQRDAEHMAYRGLHEPVVLTNGNPLPSFGTCNLRREVEFYLPWPTGERGFEHPGSGRWRLEHGLLKGSIDFVFEWQDRIYFGDWKSNSVEDYASAEIRADVDDKYRLQVQLYTLALCRLYGIDSRDYDKRFGSALYVYLRGFDGSGQGLAELRPDADALSLLEQTLVELPASGGVTGPTIHMQHEKDASSMDETNALFEEIRADDDDLDPASQEQDISHLLQMSAPIQETDVLEETHS